MKPFLYCQVRESFKHTIFTKCWEMLNQLNVKLYGSVSSTVWLFCKAFMITFSKPIKTETGNTKLYRRGIKWYSSTSCYCSQALHAVVGFMTTETKRKHCVPFDLHHLIKENKPVKKREKENKKINKRINVFLILILKQICHMSPYPSLSQQERITSSTTSYIENAQDFWRRFPWLTLTIRKLHIKNFSAEGQVSVPGSRQHGIPTQKDTSIRTRPLRKGPFSPRAWWLCFGLVLLEAILLVTLVKLGDFSLSCN